MKARPPARPRRQRGVVLIFTLIVLLILTIGAVALMRSMQNSLSSAGNLAFRRDLVNQGEQAVSTVLTEFQAGGILSSSAVTNSDLISANYKSTILPANNQGVPSILFNDTNFPTVGSVANDINVTNDFVTIRYVIDRLCNPPGGVPTSSGGAATSALCVQSSAGSQDVDARRGQGVPAPTATVYRLSVRVTGPRNTQIFLQTTFTRPD